MRRRIVQIFAALVLNPFLPNFFRGAIYQGFAKRFCVPALNCYSCPAAFGACPIGSLQVSLASVRGSLSGAADVASALISLYVAGFILLVGSLAGRFACGWLCPFGLLQDLLFLRKGKKASLGPARYLKFVLLALLVVVLPLVLPYPSSPAFCKYVCPAGTFEAGVPLIAADRASGAPSFPLGVLFAWKLSLALIILAAVLLISRFFCRTLCPLGAAWGVLNRVSLIAIRVDLSACTLCGFCTRVCPVDISIYEDPDSSECVRCLKCLKCPYSAVKLALRTSPCTEKPLAAHPDFADKVR